MKSNELFEQIHSGYIEENSTIKVMTEEGKYITEIKYKNGGLQWEQGTFNTILLCDINIEFEVEKPEIDIQNIEELNENEEEVFNDSYGSLILENSILQNRAVINKLIRAVKQLDKRKEKLNG